MTNDEALGWCKLRSVIVIHHERQTILVVPHKSIDVFAAKQNLKLTIDGGYVLAMSEPGDAFHEVVGAAQSAWKASVSMIDAMADSAGHQATPAKLTFEDQSGLFDKPLG